MVYSYTKQRDYPMPLKQKDFEFAQKQVLETCHDFWYNLLHPMQYLRREAGKGPKHDDLWDDSRDFCVPTSVGLSGSGHGGDQHSCAYLITELGHPQLFAKSGLIAGMIPWLNRVSVTDVCHPYSCQADQLMKVLDIVFGGFTVALIVFWRFSKCYEDRLVYNYLTRSSDGNRSPESPSGVRNISMGAKGRPHSNAFSGITVDTDDIG